MDRLKFKFEVIEALSASPPTNKSILTDDEDKSVVIPLAKGSTPYNHLLYMPWLLSWSFQDKRLDMQIDSRVGRNQTTVMRICDRWMQKGTTDRRGQTHPPQCTTSREEKQIVRMAVTDRSVTSLTVAQFIESVTYHSVSACTIRRRLQQSDLSARRPLLGLPLTSPPPIV
ncbi:transposable element Tcb1 transposase [Trichonephila clavipes]|nr:transposable element Tcb1 transposase [Trichonephila clavipes]